MIVLSFVILSAEVIVNYLASHVLLVYNETRQKEIIKVYNTVTKELPVEQRRNYSLQSTIPDEQCKLRSIVGTSF